MCFRNLKIPTNQNAGILIQKFVRFENKWVKDVQMVTVAMVVVDIAMTGGQRDKRIRR